jgi:NhaP-type Na+/H+ or K+/H+ antiporter
MSMTGFTGSDDLLACFVAGNAFSWDDWFRQETEEAHFQDVIDMMLNLAVFVYIGCIIVSVILISSCCPPPTPFLCFLN